MAASDDVQTGVDIEVGYMLDVAGAEWVELTLSAPAWPVSLALAYSREEAQQLVELMQGQIDRMS